MLGKRLRKLRKDKNLTQKELAQKANLTDQSIISDIERGRVIDPGFNKINLIAKALNVTTNELFGEDTLNYKNTISIQVKKFRELRGLKVPELAENSGLDPDYISGIESGKEKYHSLDILTKLAEALKIEIHELTTLDESRVLNFPIIKRKNIAENIERKSKSKKSAFTIVGDLSEYNIFYSDAFILINNVNTMAPRIQRGDLLIVTPTDKVENGDICIFQYPYLNDVDIRRYEKHGNEVFLKADNPDTILADDAVNIFPAEEVSIIYKVEAVIPKKQRIFQYKSFPSSKKEIIEASSKGEYIYWESMEYDQLIGINVPISNWAHINEILPQKDIHIRLRKSLVNHLFRCIKDADGEVYKVLLELGITSDNFIGFIKRQLEDPELQENTKLQIISITARPVKNVDKFINDFINKYSSDSKS